MQTVDTHAPIRRWALMVASLLLVGGIGVAVWLTDIKLGFELSTGFDAGCAIGEGFGCRAALTSSYSTVFGIPSSVLAMPTYVVLIVLALFGLSKAHPERARRALSYGIGILTLVCCYSLFLLYTLLFTLGEICPWCVTNHVMHFVVLALFFTARRGGLKAPYAEALSGLASFKQPALGAALALVLGGGAALLGYNMAHESALEARQAVIAEQFDAAGGGAASTNDTQKVDAGASPATATRPAREPKLLDAGYDYHAFDIGADDYVSGPMDAPVTIVAIKDFECGFCRHLTNQMKPLKKKYKDKVRVVFKHFPMNADCNYRMGSSRMHEGACRSAYTAHCAHEQGKFEAMQDMLYNNFKKFSDEQLAGYAAKVGLDMDKYKECLASDRPKAKIKEDVKLAAKLRINGTPRVYINNRMVTGSTATDVLDYYVQMAIKHPEPPAALTAVKPTESTPSMVKMATSKGDFWIDAFEASVDADGTALSVPGVLPARASWFEAKAACEKAGKRLCSQEEWVSACIGQPAVDHGNNGLFINGPVQGRLYPYGSYFEEGACRVSEDKHKGKPGKTGSKPRCRTAEGVYDLAGNAYEWIGVDSTKAAQIGGDYRGKTGATCRRRATTYGAGIKNKTTGFRCCADTEKKVAAKASDVAATSVTSIVGKTVPDDLVLAGYKGGKLEPKSFEGKVTYLTFFASWCGNCRKQMPAIKDWQKEWGDKGFQVVAINVDRDPKKGKVYIDQLDPNFQVALDPEARSMSDFDIDAMPTSFIIDQKGVIKHRVLGYRKGEISGTRANIKSLLGS